MRLIARAAAAALLVVASACGGSDSSGPAVVAGPPARVDVASTPSASIAAGSTAGTFSVKVVDAGGRGVTGVPVTFSTTGSAQVATTSGSTDASGVASTQVTGGTAAGAASVRASVSGISTLASASFIVIAGPAVKLTLDKRSIRLLSVGDTARITASAQDQYANAVPSGTVTFSATDPSLVSVDPTGLVRALRPGGTTNVIAASAGRADTSVVTVLALGATACTGLVSGTSLALGDVTTFTGTQFGCLSGTASGAEFTVVAFNSSTDGSALVTSSVAANGLIAAPAPLLSPVGGPTAIRAATGTRASLAPMLDLGFHERLMAQSSARFRGGFARARSARARLAASRSSEGEGLAPGAASYATIPSNVGVGDLLTLNVSANICTNPVNRAVRVKAVGTKSVILADTLNPSGGFSDADYTRFAARFDTLVYPLDVGAFGLPSDIDKNGGRVAVIFTLAVNQLVDTTSGYYVGGFFNPRDLFPKVGAVATDNCPGSNEGEMFYMLVPDPTGSVNGGKGIKQRAGFVDTLTTGVLAHEFQHLISGSRRVYVNTKAEDFEDVWLGEGLSHIAEELLYYRESGLAPRQNLKDSTIRIINRPTYPYWKADASSNFGRLLNYVRAPNTNSPYAMDDELTTRGATWSFLRYAADRLYTTDGAVWQRFADSYEQGLATVRTALGTDPAPLFRDWAVANYVDDLGLSSDARFQHKSWNYRDIFTTTFLNIPTYPLRTVAMTDGATAQLSVRGGSASYLRLSVGAGKEALLTFSSGGGAPNGAMQYVVVRTK
ncbi:MAG: Ig-like domain-containing protein [Gemmatimonadaceae bacterium]|nr:Ig-like domain-containing protein [Gemmatimonadaceae bacterium]